MSILSDFQRVTKSAPCPICEKPDWCLVSSERPDDLDVAVCARVESSIRFGEAGWLHRLRGDRDDRRGGRFRRQRLSVEVAPVRDLAPQADGFESLMTALRIGCLSASLGISADSLRRLHVGWTGTAWSFPMVDARGAVRGIRLRKANGKKLSVRGGREGLFVPDDIGARDRLLVCEGPTDTGAMLDLGFDAIGRPSCLGGRRLVAEYVRRHRPVELVLLADRDAVGRRGAADLGAQLRLHCRDVRIVTPPEGIGDAREWTRAGVTHEEVVQAIQRVEPLALHTSTELREVPR